MLNSSKKFYFIYFFHYPFFKQSYFHIFHYFHTSSSLIRVIPMSRMARLTIPIFAVAASFMCPPITVIITATAVITTSAMVAMVAVITPALFTLTSMPVPLVFPVSITVMMDMMAATVIAAALFPVGAPSASPIAR